MKVLLFGLLCDRAGSDHLELGAVRDTDTLLTEVLKRFPAMAETRIAVSVNRTIITTNTPVSEADEIALLPPFSGG